MKFRVVFFNPVTLSKKVYVHTYERDDYNHSWIHNGSVRTYGNPLDEIKRMADYLRADGEFVTIKKYAI